MSTNRKDCTTTGVYLQEIPLTIRIRDTFMHVL